MVERKRLKRKVERRRLLRTDEDREHASAQKADGIHRAAPSSVPRKRLLRDLPERATAKPRIRRPANRKRFTETNVLSLPAKSKQYLVWDEGTDAARGLAIMVTPLGTKSYRVVYYFVGSSKPHWKHLGRVGEMTLSEARTACREARRRARQGEDPKAGDPARSDAFKAVLEAYIKHDQIGSRGNSSALETQRVILKHTEPWHSRPVGTIRYDEVEALLWRIRDGSEEDHVKPRPYLANRLHAHLRHFFDWAARPKGPIKASPMAGMRKPWAKAAPRSRDWFKGKAGDAAIREIWRAADEIGGDEARYVKLMLITGKRKTALAEMRWKEIDGSWFWDAPPSKANNTRLHGVPLPALAQRILHPRRNEGPVFGAIRLDALQNRVRRQTGIDDFFWHGLRHLAETKCAELRDEEERAAIPPHIRDLLFDHAPARGSGKGYDHHDYKPEMRAAIEAWAAYVEGLVAAEGARVLR